MKMQRQIHEVYRLSECQKNEMSNKPDVECQDSEATKCQTHKIPNKIKYKGSKCVTKETV